MFNLLLTLASRITFLDILKLLSLLCYHIYFYKKINKEATKINKDQFNNDRNIPFDILRRKIFWDGIKKFDFLVWLYAISGPVFLYVLTVSIFTEDK